VWGGGGVWGGRGSARYEHHRVEVSMENSGRNYVSPLRVQKEKIISLNKKQRSDETL